MLSGAPELKKYRGPISEVKKMVDSQGVIGRRLSGLKIWSQVEIEFRERDVIWLDDRDDMLRETYFVIG